MKFLKIYSYRQFGLLGFTILELLITITILAILATVSFLSFSSSSTKARNGVRAMNLTDISDAINIYKIQKGSIPEPDGVTSTGTVKGKIISTKGILGDNITRLISLSDTMADPMNKTNYSYAISYDNQTFQIAATLEKDVDVGYMGNNIFADDDIFSTKVTGDYPGYIKFYTGGTTYLANIPSIIFNFSGSTNDLFDSGAYFVVDNNINYPYRLMDTMNINNLDSDSIVKKVTNNSGSTLTGIVISDILKGNKSVEQVFDSGTLESFGYSLDVVKKAIGDVDTVNNTSLPAILPCNWTGDGSGTALTCINGSTTYYPKSCNDIFTNTGIDFSGANIPTSVTYSGTSSTKFKDGIYSIDVDGSGTYSPTSVYCDMNNDGGGWTYLLNPATFSTGTSLGLTFATTANGTSCSSSPVRVGVWGNYNLAYIYRCAWNTAGVTMSWTNILGATQVRLAGYAVGNSASITLNGLGIVNTSLSNGKNIFAATSPTSSVNAAWRGDSTWLPKVTPKIYSLSGNMSAYAGGTGDGNRRGGGGSFYNVAIK